MVDNKINKGSLANLIDQQQGPIRVKQLHHTLYAWGFSKYGQTGIENCQYIIDINPVSTDNAKDIVDVSAGESNSAFITKSGALFIYGKNTFGQLGSDSTKLSYTPVLIPSLKCVKASLGGEHVLCLTQDNQLYAWGLNVFGQLGLGHTENVSVPTQIDRFGFFAEQSNEVVLKEVYRSIADERVIEIAAGPQHSMILTNKNVLFSCGFAKNGALGYYTNDLDPIESMLFTKIINKHTAKIYSNIACGLNHSGCIFGTTDILIWGKSDSFDFEGIKRYKLSKELSNQPELNLMSGTSDNSLLDFKIGENFVLILLSNGDIFSSGANDNGQLGIGFNPKPKPFEKVKVPEKIKRISVGYSYSYAIGVSGRVFGWGSNKYGQLLDIDSEVISKPLEIPQLTEVGPQLLSCGGYHAQFLCNDHKKDQNQPQLFNFKHIPLNKAFDPAQYKKNSLILNNISEQLQKEIQIQSDINDKEKVIQQLEKVINDKAQLKTEKSSIAASPSSKKGDSQSQSNSYLHFEKLFEEEIQMKDLTFPQNDFLGSGAFGDVRKAYWRKYLVAVKSLKKDMESQENQVIPFIEEYNLLKKLRHPNILLYLGGCITGPEHFLVTEYCENGNLFEFLHGIGSPKINNKDRLRLSLQIAKGVNYLHSFNPPILHRDLKSLNILLDKNYDVKIADFGWARLRTAHMTKKRGTFQWMAPEVIMKDSYTEKADVYSFGIILWEFWSNDPPYKDLKASNVAQKVKTDRNYRPKIPPDVPMEIVSLMQRCWDYEPTKRPTYLEIINAIEAFLKKI